MSHRLIALVLVNLLSIPLAHGENPAPAPAPAPGAYADSTSVAVAPAKIEPYRTFLTIQRYTIESNGDASNPISNVRLVVVMPNGSKVQLPEGNQWWPIGNNQVQEVNRTFELPWSFIQADGFKLAIQMERKGAKLLPCLFSVEQLSQFNRSYTCHTDVNMQLQAGVSQEKLDKEGVQIRVFTSKNSLPKEIPQDAIAIR